MSLAKSQDIRQRTKILFIYSGNKKLETENFK